MDREKILRYLEERFGLDRELFKDLEFSERSKGRVFAIGKEASRVVGKTKPVTAGLLFARLHGSVKPTSNIIQIFGHKATKNVLEIDKEHARDFIQGLDLDLEIKTEDSVAFTGASASSKATVPKYATKIEDKRQKTLNCTDGYVIVKYKTYPLGVGLLKENKLKNMLNKGKRTRVELL